MNVCLRDMRKYRGENDNVYFMINWCLSRKKLGEVIFKRMNIFDNFLELNIEMSLYFE